MNRFFIGMYGHKSMTKCCSQINVVKGLHAIKTILLLINCLLLTILSISCTTHSEKQIIQKKQENDTIKNSAAESHANQAEKKDSSAVLNRVDTTLEHDENEGIEFVYQVMKPQPGTSWVVCRSQRRIDFSLFYYEAASRSYFYSFNKKKDSLIVHLIYNYDKPGGMMKHLTYYHVQGFLANIPSGTYIFKLKTSSNPLSRNTFSQSIVVK